MSLERQWKLASRKHACSHTEEPFQEGQPFYTAIFLDEENGEFRREDYSEPAWDELHEDFQPFSFWRSLYEPPSADLKKKDAVDKEDAEEALKRMISENDPATEKTRYLLALMLERKKILQQIDSQEKDGVRLIIYKRRKTEEIFIVPDPGLELDEVPRIQAEVLAMMPL
ncbi:MAG: hypothetical protein ACI8T1_002887 [Verrucomicrobiales bacterium]|jgi:hypothetical protein